MDNRKKQLYNLSSQFMDVFISDLLKKHDINLDEVKGRLSDEQRANLKETVENLKVEVETFLESGGRKTITEDDQEEVEKESPLREKLRKKRESNNE